MGWEDRQKEASYKGPVSGKTFVFQWEKAEESFDKNATIFKFPDKDGAEIVSLGTGEHRFPITAFVSGDDYDLRTQEFMDILEEKGNGVLSHPIYGLKTVQPVTVNRKDDTTENANQASIAILFIESSEIAAKGTQEDIKNRIDDAQKDFNKDTPKEYKDQKRQDSAQDSANSEARIGNELTQMDKILAPIAAFNEDVNTFYQAVNLSINNNLTDLIGKPFTMASQIITLIKTPGRIVQSFSLRVSGYADIATQLRASSTITSITNDSRNNLLENTFMLATCIAALAETILLENFKTKNEALTAAAILLDFHALNRDFIELEESKFQDTPLELLLYGDSEMNNTLNLIVEETASALASLSFNLQQERIIELVRDRNLIELAFELYGNLDPETLDLLISSNNLTGEEIILIPKGRLILYYV